MQLKRTNDALSLLLKAKEIDDRKSTTYINLASWYLNDGQLQQALAHSEAALERAEWVVSAHVVRVTTLVQMKRTKQARQALIEALRIAPEDPALRRLARQIVQQN